MGTNERFHQTMAHYGFGIQTAIAGIIQHVRNTAMSRLAVLGVLKAAGFLCAGFFVVTRGREAETIQCLHRNL